ncbi:MAG: DNA/RNA nuclease SfsA [Rhizobiaceae bacterium]|nr:DNA/RNA nuclease SfsA [Rhizobiaceae bacterium]
MQFETPLTRTTLVKRYKRFLADVQLESGEVITVHCANPGSMLGLTEPGIPAFISDSGNPKRKLRYSLEMVEVGGTLVGVNTNMPNKLAVEAIQASRIPALTGFDILKTEVRYGENSRIDILLETENAPSVFVEVKNVHFVRTPGIHEFPDSVTARGAKHLEEMANEVAKGNRAAMLYVIQRGDGDRFKIAADLDPNYAAAFERATQAGVEAHAIRCDVREDRIDALDLIPIL